MTAKGTQNGTSRLHRAARLAAIAIVAAGAAAGLSACGSSIDAEKPVGIGSTPNTLKSSPCGCLELPNLAREG